MWLEEKYIGLISSRLERFKRVNNRLFNCRCPICGDSQKNKFKARGYLFPKDDGGYLYHCHNCNITLGVDKFLETLDPVIHKEYLKEKLQNGFGKKQRVLSDVEVFANKMKTPVFIKATPLKQLKKVSQLRWDHPVKNYVNARKIPTPYQAKLFYAPKFKKWVNDIIPGKFKSIENDTPRLIIPFLDENKNLFGFQGRAFSDDEIRYITIMLNDEKPKIFGLDTCDRSKPHFILEGPIDSMFIDNSIAMAGGSIDWNYVNEQSIFVYDNEPRSIETCKKIRKVMDKGCQVVIFPDIIKEKDINDMVLEDINVNELLRNNISNNLQANIKYTSWKKI